MCRNIKIQSHSWDSYMHMYTALKFLGKHDSNKSVQVWWKVILKNIFLQIMFETQKRNTEIQKFISGGRKFQKDAAVKDMLLLLLVLNKWEDFAVVIFMMKASREGLRSVLQNPQRKNEIIWCQYDRCTVSRSCCGVLLWILSYQITGHRLFTLLPANSCFGLYYAQHYSLGVLHKLTWLVFISYLMPWIFCFQHLSKRFLKEFSVPTNMMLDSKLFQLFIIYNSVDLDLDSYVDLGHVLA